MSKRNSRPVGTTQWGRALLEALIDPDDKRRVERARSYFQARKTSHLRLADATASASVQGSQPEPFAITLRFPQVDVELAVRLARAEGWDGDTGAVARGHIPLALGECVAPSERSDVEQDCTCPDDAAALCTHALTVVYELAARIDEDPTRLLTLAGISLAELLESAGGADMRTVASPQVPAAAPYRALVLPRAGDVDPLTHGDRERLHTALRASGIAESDFPAAIAELDRIYAEIARWGSAQRTAADGAL